MEARELFLAFIADEDRALIEKRQGKFYPCQHHNMSKHLKNLFKLLDKTESKRCCYHFLRVVGGLVTVKNQGDYEILKDAYRETFNWKEQGYDKPSYDVFMTTMIFGFSDKKIIDGGSNLTTYLKYLKVSSQLNAYSSLSGMIKKISRFEPYADDETANRIIESLRSVGYLHHDYNGRYEQYYDYNCLSFWGMIIILLINPLTREHVCSDMESLSDKFPLRDEHLNNLYEFKKAVEQFLDSPA